MLYPVASKVTITSGSYQGVALEGKIGRVRGFTDLAKADIIHVVDLDAEHCFKVPNGTGNPPSPLNGAPIWGLSGPEPREFPITYVEIPASCLS